MKKDINIKQAFYMEPEEIVNYFKSKGLKTSYNWREVYEEAHARAFTVAKMTDIDLLKDTHEMLTKSIKEGWSEGHFRSEAKDLFNKKGWSGFKEVENPNTGELETVELGTPRRIKNIFKSNINSAYAAGRYKEQLEDVDIAPYLQYMCVLDESTRPEHRALHGKIFRYDDPFWAMFYPPNGWGCRCYVRSLTEDEIKKRGLTVDKSGDNLKEINTGDKRKPAEGESGASPLNAGAVRERPVGSYKFKLGGKEYNVMTDAGWSTNIGAHAWNLDVLAYNKIEKLPQNLKDKFISDMASNPHNKKVVQNYVEKSIKKDYQGTPQEITLTWFTPKIINALKANGKEPVTPVVSMKLGKTTHTRRNAKIETGQALSPEQTKNIWNYINTADEIYIDTQDFALIYIKHLPKNEIKDGRDIIKIPVKINNTNKKMPVNYVGTLSKIHSDDIKGDRFKRIE